MIALTLGRIRSQTTLIPRTMSLLAVAIICSGCDAGLSLATLGSIAGAAGSAYTTGKAVFALGKLDSAEMATLDETAIAARAAAADLGLVFQRDCKPQKDPTIVELPWSDDKEAKINIRIERRAPHLVRVRIDVGLFGSEVTARLVLTRLRAHLPPLDKVSWQRLRERQED
jgi:hypothetical protein